MNNTNLLQISDLHVEVEDRMILNGLNLDVAPGELHAIMGPNGSGKSTLAQVLAGRDKFEVIKSFSRCLKCNVCQCCIIAIPF